MFIVFILVLFIMVIFFLFDGVWSEWFYKGFELLVVVCLCVLVIFIFVVIVFVIGNVVKNGVFIKGGMFLEKVGVINVIVFDKIGMLIEGKLVVLEVVFFVVEENQFLVIIKMFEDYLNYFIVCVIVDYVEEKKVGFL